MSSTLFSGVAIVDGLLDRLAQPMPPPVPQVPPASPVADHVAQRLGSELKRISAMTDQLRKTISVEPPTPEHAPDAPKPFIAQQSPSRQQLSELAEVGERVKKFKRDARDAWFACILMGLFIVGGIIWSSERIGEQEAKIKELTVLLNAEKSAAFARVDSMQKLQLQIAAMKRTQVPGMKPVETVRVSTDE